MGCDNSKNTPQGTLLEQYHAANLPQPWSDAYENNFEKEIYMGINLCRHDPKRFIPYVKQVYKEHVLLRAGAGKNMAGLVAKLQASESLPMLRFDQGCNDACRQNNAAVIEKNEDKPTQGGNIAKYTELSGSDKTNTSKEFTMVKFEGTTGTEFVALQLALDFEKMSTSSKKEEEKKPAASSELTAPPVTSDGANAMDGGVSAQPNAMDGGASAAAAAPKEGEAAAPKEGEAAAPKEGEAATAAKDTSKTDKAAASKKPATAKPEGYSPILDKNIELVGISNKAHKKTINVIQVLYAEQGGNAMM